MIKKSILLLLVVLLAYGGGRLYYAVTGGFTLGNITSDLPHHPKWDTHFLSASERDEVSKALDQEYTYLGRGCQAYVFASEDGNYVVKFFKYQRFRPQWWINGFTFIPAVDAYQKVKTAEKQEKLDKVFTSWKIAYDKLRKETGVVYVQLNKGDQWNRSILIRDKMGMQHKIGLDGMEFMLQRRAVMLCPAIDQMVQSGNSDKAELLIDRLLTMLLSEYARGYADNDHALMQNTGVLDGYPIHIDIGQFIKNAIVKSPKVYKQELYDKTYLFHRWLQKRYPNLAGHLRTRLVAIIGPDYFYRAPYVHKGDVAKIPNQ